MVPSVDPSPLLVTVSVYVPWLPATNVPPTVFSSVNAGGVGAATTVMATPVGSVPAGTVSPTVLVAVSITDTVSLALLAT